MADPCAYCGADLTYDAVFGAWYDTKANCRCWQAPRTSYGWDGQHRPLRLVS